MTIRNKYIIDEQGIFNQILETLPESQNVDKILRTLDVIEDKAEITDGRQKRREFGVIYRIIKHHKDNDSILEKCFNTLATLSIEGEKKYQIGEDYDSLPADIYYTISELGKDDPKLQKYAKKCMDSILRYNDDESWPVKRLHEAAEDLKESQIEDAWDEHEKTEQKNKEKAKKKTEREISAYVKDRCARVK